MAPFLKLLYTITIEKTVKLMQIDSSLSASTTSPAETRSNNSGKYVYIPYLSLILYLSGYCPVKGGGQGQSIGSTFSDAIVGSSVAGCGRLRLEAVNRAN